MITILYIDDDLNTISNAEIINKLENIHQDAVIESAAVSDDDNLFQIIEANLPRGFSLLHPDESDYEIKDNFICVPIQIEYGSVQEFKKDAYAIHDGDNDYFNKWLLCCFLSDSLPFDAAARAKSWFNKE